MVCWAWMHSGYVLQTNFCSRDSSQLCTCRSKPQRPEFSSKVTLDCSWVENTIRRAVAACHAGMTLSSKATSALQEDMQRSTQLSICSQQAAKTLHRNTVVMVETSCFLHLSSCYAHWKDFCSPPSSHGDSQNTKDATMMLSFAMFETFTRSRCALSYLLGI